MNRMTTRLSRTLTLFVAALGLTLGVSASQAFACDNHAKAGHAAGQGCGCAQGAETAQDEGDEVKLVHQGVAKVGDKTLCPIMGSPFVVADDTPSVEHDGKTIFFCCGGCTKGFADDPAGILAATNTKIDEANATE